MAATQTQGIFGAIGRALDEALTESGGSRSGSGSGRPSAGPAGDASAGDDPLQVAEDAAGAVFVASCILSLCLYCARSIFTLGLLCLLGAAWLQNPARDPSLRHACWAPLLAARHSRVGEKTEAKLAAGSLFGALKSAVLDGGIRLARSKRVLVDLTFGCCAYFDSSSKIDLELCAVGLFGAWYVVQSRALRDWAASYARPEKDGGGQQAEQQQEGPSRR